MGLREQLLLVEEVEEQELDHHQPWEAVQDHEDQCKIIHQWMIEALHHLRPQILPQRRQQRLLQPNRYPTDALSLHLVLGNTKHQKEDHPEIMEDGPRHERLLATTRLHHTTCHLGLRRIIRHTDLPTEIRGQVAGDQKMMAARHLDPV